MGTVARSKTVIAASLIGLALSSTANAQVTQRVSVAWNGAQGSGDGWPSISGDGRFVVFQSGATNMVPGGTTGPESYLRDRWLGTTERLGVGAHHPWISPDGRHVVLVMGWYVYIRDRQTGITEVASVDSAGLPPNDRSSLPSLSDDGRFVVFSSDASNLVPGDTNMTGDVFVRDRLLSTTERVSVGSGGEELPFGNGPMPGRAAITADGRYVAFATHAGNLVPGDTNGASDVFIRDRTAGTTERVSVDSTGAQYDHNSHAPSFSADGRFLAYQRWVGPNKIFVLDRQLGTTELVSDVEDSTWPTISADGRYVAFNRYGVVSLRDRQLGTLEVISVDFSGTPSFGGEATVSADGLHVVFRSGTPNLVPDDTNGWYDQFVRDRVGGPAFVSLCSPGVGGVLACPCANAPNDLGRGCNNSSNTGGAALSASGGTYLSSDSLVFTTTGQRPTALSILAQWVGSSSAGVAFGMGVRCTSGTLRRLYSKNAVGGSITVPNFGGGDQAVSARSAAKGDMILVGQSRWYVVYYRDNTILGGCDPWRNFNATQTGQVTWSP